MTVLRLLGNIALWIGALLGVVAGGMFIANKMEIVNPLIVISGSMEPGIHTGDLLIDTKVETAELEVGDVVSLPSDLTHKLVSHRIVQIEHSDEGPAGTSWKVYMKGDANEFEDIAPYYVGDEVWSPKMQLPHMGVVVSKMMNPGFSLPIVLALVALLGISLLSEESVSDTDEDEEEDDVDGDPDRPLGAALDEIDLALAALGITLDDSTIELERERLEPVMSR
jgi:signal peptidase I